MNEIEMLSLDLSNFCSKECEFCYNHSMREGNTLWMVKEVLDFTRDCVANGVKAISLGGGEPFEYDGVFEIISVLREIVYLSVTSNGLPLEDVVIWEALKANRPDKIHLTIHKCFDSDEVARVINRLKLINELGIKPGVNLLVSSENIDSAKVAYRMLRDFLDKSQIILVPQRYSLTPTPKQLAIVSGGDRM